jgi:DNA-binding FadR family transcriptional regulator
MEHKIKPGDLLPNESVLAESMGISRSSVREAMKILSTLGVVDVRRGDGTYVTSDIGRTLLDPFLLRLMMSEHDQKQMVEFRVMIESEVTRAIIKNKNNESISLIQQAIQKMEDALLKETETGIDEWVGLDIDFHIAMAKATGNKLMEQLYEFIMKFFEPSIQRTYNQQDNIRQALSYHKNIFYALQQGDEKATLDALENSIHAWAGKDNEL